MYMERVTVLKYSMERISSVGYLTDTSTGYDCMINLPFIIPIIDIPADNKTEIMNLIHSKRFDIFTLITGRNMPQEMISEIEDVDIKIRTNVNDTHYSRDNNFILFVGMNNCIYLVNGLIYKYFRLLTKDIFILYVSDNTDDNHIHTIENRIFPYLLNKKVVMSDTFNINTRTRITKETGIRKILDYNLYKMMEFGWSDESISFLIVYDNLPIDKIIETERATQQIGRYYESFFIGDQKQVIYNIDFQDMTNLSVSSVHLPTFGKEVIELFHI